jgi:hypothetical protein
MSPVVLALFCVLAFLLALASDYLETKYVRAINRHVTYGDRRAAEAAARCSVAMWLVGVIGLIACVEISWLLVLPEGLGLYIGTKLALRG